jgi:hypothetical protein
MEKTNPAAARSWRGMATSARLMAAEIADRIKAIDVRRQLAVVSRIEAERSSAEEDRP